MIVIGLTGGIGTGKSTVTKTLEEMGSYVVDADKLGHEAYRPSTEVWKLVVDTFGEDILQPNGEVDRRKLGAIVFSDPQALERLNQIVHPWMYQEMKHRLEELRRQDVRVVVLEAAILIEASWTSLVDQVWVTTAPMEVVVERLRSRNGLSREQVLARVQSQMPTEERVKHADVVVDTDCPLAEVPKRVAALWKEHVLPNLQANREGVGL